MKGPGIRLDLDVRREWECPECGKRGKTGGDVVTLRCSCCSGDVNMQLVEKLRQVRSFADVIERIRTEPKMVSEEASPSATNGLPESGAPG